jgi:hypothetical protein
MKIVQSLDGMTCENIVQSRGLKGFNKGMWKKLQTQGSFTANKALDLGLIYNISKLDLLGDLMGSNKDDELKAIMK